MTSSSKRLLFRMSVRTKISALTSLLLALILLMVVLLVSRNMREVIEEETRKRGVAIAQLFGATNLNHTKHNNFQAVQQNAQMAKAENQLAYVIVYSKDGRIGAHTEDNSVLHEIPKELETRKLLTLDRVLFREIVVPSRDSAQSERVFDIVLPVYAPESAVRWATVRIGISAENMHRHLRQTRIHLLQIGLVCLALGILGSALLAGKITTPLVKLKEGSLRAATGDLSSRISVKSGDELEALAENFNFMMDQIRKHQEERIRSEKLAAVGYMVNTIVHDCRTPITVIKGFASLLREFELSPDKTQESLYFINFEVERMERMLDEILQFAVQKKTSLALTDAQLDDFVGECCTEIEVLLKHTQIQFLSQLNAKATVRIDPDKLRRAILNIAANAREALKGSGEIRVATGQEDGCAVIKVSDSGPGIPAEVQWKIFDPFFTHGKSMGFGLGMSITRKIVEDHQGRIHLHSQVGQGTTFTIQIPLLSTQGSAPGTASQPQASL
jgi:signal transduction histidine kinase